MNETLQAALDFDAMEIEVKILVKDYAKGKTFGMLTTDRPKRVVIQLASLKKYFKMNVSLKLISQKHEYDETEVITRWMYTIKEVK